MGTNKVIALTFDDGPTPGSTEQILAILAQNSVKATFFVVGNQLAANAALGRAVRDGGHAIGNHSQSHLEAPADPDAEVQQADAVIESVYGGPTGLFRPPFGNFSNGVVTAAQTRNHAVIIWSVDPKDWSMPGTDSIVNTVLGGATPGGIVLLHDGGGDRSQTIAALPRIISGLSSQGYRFVTVPELLALAFSNSNPRSTDALPIVSILTPGLNYSYQSLSATGTVRDAGTGVSGVQATLRRFSDGQYWNGSTWIASPTSLRATLGAGTWNLPLTSLPDGRYTLAVSAANTAGQASAPLARDFWIDNLAPSTVIVSPVTATTYAPLNGANGTVSDGGGGGVSSVSTALMRSDGAWWTGTTWSPSYSEGRAVLSGGTNWSFVFPSFSSGTYTFYARGFDYVGNVGVWARSDFSISASSARQGRLSGPPVIAGPPVPSSRRF